MQDDQEENQEGASDEEAQEAEEEVPPDERATFKKMRKTMSTTRIAEKLYCDRLGEEQVGGELGREQV